TSTNGPCCAGPPAAWPVDRSGKEHTVGRLLVLTIGILATGPVLTAEEPPARVPKPPLIRSARSGPWSAPATWEGARTPTAGARVQVRAGHTVVYDVRSDALIRSVHVAGTLS